MSNWPFRYQIIFLSSTPALFVWLALTFNTIYTSWDTLLQSHQRYGAALANQIAPSCEFAIFSGDMTPLKTLLEKNITNSDILMVELYDTEFHLLLQVGNRIPPQQQDSALELTFTAPIHSSLLQVDEMEQNLSSRQLGTVSITLSPSPILQTQQRIIEQAIWLGALSLLLIGVLVLLLSNRFTRIFRALRSAMDQIARGDFSPPKHPLPSSGELGELSQDLHKMAAALDRNRKATLAAYEQLQQRAEEAERFASSSDTPVS